MNTKQGPKQKLGPWQEAWVRSLESGIKQCQYVLCLYPAKRGQYYSYCCLGVACEVAIANGVKLDTRTAIGGIIMFGVQHDVLPPKIAKLFKFRSSEGKIERESFGDPRSLAHANDTFQWSFKEIAKFVRKYPEKVFTKPA